MERDMTLNEYQHRAMQTCMESCDNFSYMFLNLVGEVGELSSKVAKLIRKEKAVISENDFVIELTSIEDALDDSIYDEMKKEAGDILWQLAGFCKVMGWDLNDVASANLEKLASRKQRGVIDGCGDNR